MFKKLLSTTFALFVFSVASTQDKKITLEEIWGGAFQADYMDVLRSMKDGKHYTILNRTRNPRGTQIDKYEYATQENTGTILASSLEIPLFSSYEFSDDESQIILATEVERVFRHSRLGVYYVYDVASKSVTKISENKIQEPELSPDGSKVDDLMKPMCPIFLWMCTEQICIPINTNLSTQKRVKKMPK